MTTALLFLLGLMTMGACYWTRNWLRMRRQNLALRALHREYDEMEADFERLQREIKKENRQYRRFQRERDPHPHKTKFTKSPATTSVAVPLPSGDKRPVNESTPTNPGTSLRQASQQPDRPAPKKRVKAPRQATSNCAGSCNVESTHNSAATADHTKLSEPKWLVLAPATTPPSKNVIVNCLASFLRACFVGYIIKLRPRPVSPPRWWRPLRQALSKWLFPRPPDCSSSRESLPNADRRQAA